eukprot:8517045-Alexandrium_andersonii.AAC.1
MSLRTRPKKPRRRNCRKLGAIGAESVRIPPTAGVEQPVLGQTSAESGGANQEHQDARMEGARVSARGR